MSLVINLQLFSKHNQLYQDEKMIISSFIFKVTESLRKDLPFTIKSYLSFFKIDSNRLRLGKYLHTLK